MLFTIDTIGLNRSNDYTDFPNGRSKGVILHFTSPARILTSSGFENIYPGECLVTFSGTPAKIIPHKDCPDRFSNNHIFFTDDALCKEIIHQYGIPHHTIIRNIDFSTMNSLFRKLYIEHTTQPNMYQEQIDLLMRQLFIYLSRAANSKCKDLTLPKNQSLISLIQTQRINMYLNPSSYTSVHQLAKNLNICTGYFRNLYTALFDISPMQDFLTARIEYAKSLLSTTDTTVSEIAEQCGFEDQNYFSRAFKSQMHMTPSEYRKQF